MVLEWKEKLWMLDSQIVATCYTEVFLFYDNDARSTCFSTTLRVTESAITTLYAGSYVCWWYLYDSG